MNKYTIRDIAEIGIFVGLALILNLPVFCIHISPNAGSINFVFVPLLVIAIRHSWWKTLIASSIVYALPACLIDGYGLQTYPLDYMLAYGSVVIVSLFRNKITSEDKSSYFYLVIAVILATSLRYLCHTLSSVLLYEYNFIAALTFNAVYVFTSGGASLAILLLLLKPLQVLNKKFSYQQVETVSKNKSKLD